MVFQRWRIIRKDGKTYRLRCGVSPLPPSLCHWCRQDVQSCLPKLQGHYSSELICTPLPAFKPVSKSCCSLWRKNYSQFSACHSTVSQTPTSVALSQQQSKPHTILCHFTPPSQPQPGLFSTPVSHKRDREHKFNLGNVSRISSALWACLTLFTAIWTAWKGIKRSLS